MIYNVFGGTLNLTQPTTTRCLKINQTPQTFYCNCVKIALISIKTGTQTCI